MVLLIWWLTMRWRRLSLPLAVSCQSPIFNSIEKFKLYYCPLTHFLHSERKKWAFSFCSFTRPPSSHSFLYLHHSGFFFCSPPSLFCSLKTEWIKSFGEQREITVRAGRHEVEMMAPTSTRQYRGTGNGMNMEWNEQDSRTEGGWWEIRRKTSACVTDKGNITEIANLKDK